MQAVKKIIFSCGGTGGHLFPAIAAVQEINARQLNVKMLFLISDHHRESEILRYYGFDYEKAISSGIKNVLRRPWLIKDLLQSVWRSFRVIASFRPDVIVGFGGFVACFPVLIGFMLGIRCYIHEQNLIPGRITRMLSQVAKKIFITFPQTSDRLASRVRGRITVTGNPVRTNLRASVDKKVARKRLGLDEGAFTILILGGSQGAHALNLLMGRLCARIKLLRPVQFIHLTGSKDLPEVEHHYKEGGVKALSFDFFQEMGLLYSAADLVVSRSGATALTEIIFYHLPSILIPYPFAVDDHQRFNAQFYADKGVSVLLDEKKMSDGDLLKAIEGMMLGIDHGEFVEKFKNVETYGSKTTISEVILN